MSSLIKPVQLFETKSINVEIETIKKLPPLMIIWSIDGDIKDINQCPPEVDKSDLIGRHFSHFETPMFDNQIFDDCIQNQIIQYTIIKTPSVIDPTYLLSWNGCLEPIIKNGEVIEVKMTGILIDTINKSDPKFTRIITKDEANSRQLLFSDTGYWEWEIKTNKIIWSDKTWELFNLDNTKFEATYDIYMAQIHPDDQPIVMRQVETILQDGNPFMHHIRINPKTNFSTIVECRGRVLKNQQGEPLILQGSIQDITQYKKLHTEIQLQETYRLLNLLSENAPGMTYQLERYPNGRVKYLHVGTECERLLHLTREEILNDAFLTIRAIHPEDRQDILVKIEKSAKEVVPFDFVGRFIVDEKIKWIHGKSIPHKKKDGRIIWDGFLSDITEKKQLEADLDAKIKELNTIAQNIPGVVYQLYLHLDGSLTFPYVSEGCQKVLNVSAEEIMADSMKMFFNIHPEDMDRVMEKVQESANNLTAFDEKYRKIIDGKVRWFYCRAIPERLSGGTISWYGISLEITHEKELELNIIKKHKQLEMVTKNLDSVVYQTKRVCNKDSLNSSYLNNKYLAQKEDYSILFVNESVQSVYGISISDLMNDPLLFFSAIHPDDQEKMHQSIQKSLLTLTPLDCTYRIIVNKKEKWIHEQTNYQQLSDGAIIGTGVSIDITHQQSLEQDLQEKYQQLEFIKKNLPGMVSQCELHPDGTFIFSFVSDGCREIYEISAEEIMSDASTLFKTTHPDDIKGFEKSIEKSAKNLSLWDHIFRVIINGTIKTLHGKALPSRRDDGRVVWEGLTHDISLQKKLEAELRLSEKEIERATMANQLKTEFLGDISHELRTPLNAINGFSELLLEGFVGKLNKKQMQYLEEINKGGEYLLKLINTIIEFSIIEQDQMELNLQPINLLEFLTELKGGLMPILLAKQLSLTVHSSLNDIVLSVDSIKLQQILTNIVHNSIKHSKENGEILINITKELGKVIIEVVDFGSGILKSKQKQLFNPTHIRKRQKESLINDDKGTGLGLSITRQLVELMGGEISIYSEGKNKGVVVQIQLPV